MSDEKKELPDDTMSAEVLEKLLSFVKAASKSGEDTEVVSSSGPRRVTWCAFRGDGGLLGMCILEGEVDPVSACMATEFTHINPGGQLTTAVLSEDDLDVPKRMFKFMWENRNRLIQADLAKALFDACIEAGWLESRCVSSVETIQ